jgi:hypothetical protein
LDELERRFLAAARALPPSSKVPYAFEKRVMAALAAQVADPWSLWARLLWRAAAPCVGIMLAMTVWTVVAGQLSPSDAGLAAELEQTVWAPLSSINETW